MPDNVQIIKDAYASFQRGEIQSILNVLTDDVTWHSPGPSDIPYAGKRTGRNGAAEFFAKLIDADEILAFEPRTYFSDGNTVVVLGRYSARVRKTGRSYDAGWVHVFTMRDGRVAGWEEFYDTAAAAEAYKTEAAVPT